MLRLLVVGLFVTASWIVSAWAAERVVTQKNKQFSASEMTIKAGDAIVFKNDDDVAHNVFSNTEGFRFNLKIQTPGASAGTSFNQEGKAEIRCVIHPQMKLLVDVKK